MAKSCDPLKVMEDSREGGSVVVSLAVVGGIAVGFSVAVVEWARAVVGGTNGLVLVAVGVEISEGRGRWGGVWGGLAEGLSVGVSTGEGKLVGPGVTALEAGVGSIGVGIVWLEWYGWCWYGWSGTVGTGTGWYGAKLKLKLEKIMTSV